MWQFYLKLLGKRPILTNTLTAGVVAFTGDVFAQQAASYFFENERLLGINDIDYRRLAQVSAWGLTYLGAPMYFWFRRLDRWFPPNGGIQRLLTKLAVNQTTAAPVSNAAFFAYVQVYQGNLFFVVLLLCFFYLYLFA